MSQHDYSVANGGGAQVRGDINDALKALAGNNAGPQEPEYKVPGMFWLNTGSTPNRLCIRNQADTAWIVIAEIDKGLVKTTAAAEDSELVRLAQVRELLASLVTGAADASLNATDKGKLLMVTAGVNVPKDIFMPGDVVTLYNDTEGALSVTQGASMALRMAGTNAVGNRTLASRGIATIVFVRPAEAVISGSGLS